MRLDPLYLIPVAVFLGMVLASLGIILLLRFRMERRRMVDKIRESGADYYYSTRDDGDAESMKKAGPFQRLLASMLGPIGSRISPKDDVNASELRKSFLRAGYRGDFAIPVYYGAKVVCTVMVVGAFFFLNRYYFRITTGALNMSLTILAALIGYSLPTYWLRFKTMRRKRKIFEGLPDALDMMVVCVEAGMGIDAAIHRVSEEIHLENRVISDEFKVVGLELRAGKLRSDALRSLAMRCDHEDVSSLVALLIQTDKFGTSIAQALRVHSDAMRTKRFQLAEEQAAKIPVKLVFPLIFFIFPALFVVIVGPAAITIYRNIIAR